MRNPINPLLQKGDKLLPLAKGGWEGFKKGISYIISLLQRETSDSPPPLAFFPCQRQAKGG
jgi:hypothetical protein